jgi:acid stress chaperone HdeB
VFHATARPRSTREKVGRLSWRRPGRLPGSPETRYNSRQSGSQLENSEFKGVVMHPKLAVLGLIFAVSAASSAQAQVTVDVTKINCDQFVHHKISTPNLIAAWISGYYNAKRNNRIIDLEILDENVSKVKNYCSDEKNFKVPVMKAVEQVLGKRK